MPQPQSRAAPARKRRSNVVFDCTGEDVVVEGRRFKDLCDTGDEYGRPDGMRRPTRADAKRVEAMASERRLSALQGCPGDLTRALRRLKRPFEPGGKQGACPGEATGATTGALSRETVRHPSLPAADHHSVAKQANRLKRSTIKTCCAVLCAFS